MSKIDTNVSSYTFSELMAIVGLADLSSRSEIVSKTNKYIQQYSESDPSISAFFKEVQGQLLQYIDDIDSEGKGEDNIYSAGEKQTDDRYENEYLRQSDAQQTSKITERKQKIQLYGNQHVPMTREQLGVNDTFNVSVKQDSLNPNLQNTITRFVNLDSQFRQACNGNECSSTNYTLDLSDRLNNTISLCLYSYQIPNTWYVIDAAYKNTCFWIVLADKEIAALRISVSPGNYSPSQIASELNAAIVAAGFTNEENNNVFVTYNASNGKLTIALYNAMYISESAWYRVDERSRLVFYDFSASLQCEASLCGAPGGYMTQSLGWLLGFRLPSEQIRPNGNIGVAAVDLNGTKYLILVIDDFNQNRVNNGLVTITELSSKLKLPNYYSPSLTNVTRTFGEETNNNMEEETNANYLASTKIPVVVPSAPRTLTFSQIYTINEITKNKVATSTNYRPKAPTSSDIMAILPLKGGSASIPTGTLLAEFSGSLQQNVRTYFGPVNIDRMAVKLLDDKGNILNLNGCDWCVTLIATCLYQY